MQSQDIFMRCGRSEVGSGGFVLPNFLLEPVSTSPLVPFANDNCICTADIYHANFGATWREQ